MIFVFVVDTFIHKSDHQLLSIHFSVISLAELGV